LISIFKLKCSKFFYQLVICLDLIFLTHVGSDQIFVAGVRSGQVSHIWFGFEKFFLWVKKIFSGWVKKYRVKGRSASYLLPVKSMLGLCRVRAHLYYQLKNTGENLFTEKNNCYAHCFVLLVRFQGFPVSGSIQIKKNRKDIYFLKICPFQTKVSFNIYPNYGI